MYRQPGGISTLSGDDEAQSQFPRLTLTLVLERPLLAGDPSEIFS